MEEVSNDWTGVDGSMTIVFTINDATGAVSGRVISGEKCTDMPDIPGLFDKPVAEVREYTPICTSGDHNENEWRSIRTQYKDRNGKMQDYVPYAWSDHDETVEKPE